jgi:Ca-activated chloride channel family protein
MRLAAPLLLLVAFSLAGCGREEVPQTMPTTAAAQAAAKPTAPAKPRWPFSNAAEPAAASGGLDQAASIRRNYYVVFDASGSMHDAKCSGGESKIEVAKRALVEFADKLPRDVNLGLSVFDSQGIREILALSPIKSGSVASAIAPIRAGGGTPLADSIHRAAEALTVQGQRQFGYGEFHLVVITDGEATGENPKKVVDRVLASSPIVLHTIGFCIGEDHSLNQPGKVIYRAADNPAELARGLADVLAESPAFATKSFK